MRFVDDDGVVGAQKAVGLGFGQQMPSVISLIWASREVWSLKRTLIAHDAADVACSILPQCAWPPNAQPNGAAAVLPD